MRCPCQPSFRRGRLPPPRRPRRRTEAGLYRALLFPRLIEEKMLLLLRQGRLSKWFSGMGQEAIAVGVTAALRADDWILPMHRNLGVFTARGLDLLTLFRQLLGKRRRLHPRPRPHVPLRRAREAHRRDDQPPGRDAAGGGRAGPRRPAARASARWPPPSRATARRARATSTRP